MSGMVTAYGEVIDDKEARRRILETIKRCGRFIMQCTTPPPRIGEVQQVGPFPMRCVRIVTYQEALADWRIIEDLRGPCGPCDPDPENAYFEVECAD